MNAIITHLEHLFQAVSQAVLTKGPEQSTFLGQNAKGDQVKWFDLAADQAVARYLAEQFPEPVQLLSEEGEPRTFGQGRPRFTLVLDPVAVVPYGQPVGVETVQAPSDFPSLLPEPRNSTARSSSGCRGKKET
jgi:fructose-1,6-bisphosphatase